MQEVVTTRRIVAALSLKASKNGHRKPEVCPA